MAVDLIAEQCPVCGEQTFDCARTNEGEFCYCVNCGYSEEPGDDE